MLTGSGTAGAYHAGVLRALHEAGVRTDLVAGRGAGAASAMFAAVDGGVRLWDATGLWKGQAAAGFYPWRGSLRVAGWALAAAGALLLFPLLLFACAIAFSSVGLLLTLAGLEQAGSALTAWFAAALVNWFSPGALPTIIPRLVLLAVLIGTASVVAGFTSEYWRRRVRRRTRLGLVWRLLGSPLSARSACGQFTAELWKLMRGAAPLQRPGDSEFGRRYVELLSDNLGQPGFRELLVVVHDIDARQDLVFAFLAERYRGRFFGSAAGRPGSTRTAEAFDLAGVARDQAFDALASALAMPLATEPHLVRFPREGAWRGETHRACDRPGSLARLLEEVAAAGAEQVILVSASARPGRPHELSANPADLRGRAGEQLSAFESAGLRDVVEQFGARFTGLHVIRPDHNPLGPLDFGGVHDERSDRRFTVAELVDRGYEDAYRQFVEPVVGASGERMETIQAGENRRVARGAIEL